MMDATQGHILIVEDDDDLRSLVEKRLSEEGFHVETASDGLSALEAVDERVPDLVLLDVMLPGLDGIEVCRRLRADHPLLYIMMLTAKAEELDRVVGLEVGADDYVTKPFSLQEVVARVRASLRRIRRVREHMAQSSNGVEMEDPIVIGALQVDPMRRQVFVDGEEVHLTVREFDLLQFLIQNPERPFTRMQLLDSIWGIKYEGYDRTIDSHIQRLRAKIEKDPANPMYVRTVWGVGYKMAAE